MLAGTTGSPKYVATSSVAKTAGFLTTSGLHWWADQRPHQGTTPWTPQCATAQGAKPIGKTRAPESSSLAAEPADSNLPPCSATSSVTAATPKFRPSTHHLPT